MSLTKDTKEHKETVAERKAVLQKPGEAQMRVNKKGHAKKYNIIEITWEDAIFDTRQFSPENVGKRKGIYSLKTVGYLVHEDDTRVAIAMQYCSDTRDEVRQVCWIPKSTIKKRKEL